MSTSGIRGKSICVLRRRDEILVGPAFDPTKKEAFYCPPGGGIEFGERAIDAVHREMREELQIELHDVELLGVLENIFTYDNCPGHELVFVFRARATDPTIYERDEIMGEENGQPMPSRWIPLEQFGNGTLRLYPHGLCDLLRTAAD